MKTQAVLFAAALLCLAPDFINYSACAQGTSFTYQGRLNTAGAPAEGYYDFRFRLAADALANNYVGGNVFTNGIAISNGLFAVTLDFGSVFNGSNYWLETAVRTNGGGGYTTLNPLQPLTPTPYAIFAAGASNVLGVLSSGSLSGTYSSAVTFGNPGNSFSGAFSGNGGGLTNVNAATLNGMASGNFWQTSGNTGTAASNYLGTTDNRPLELRVNGQRALRLIPDIGTNNSPNIIGGSPTNAVTSGLVGVTISGGNMNNIGLSSLFTSSNNPFGDQSSFPTIGASYTTIGGGFLNQIQTNGTFSTIAGGALNVIQSDAIESVIAGGFANTILPSAAWSTIAGGTYHTIGDINGFIGGGWTNRIEPGGGIYSVIAGGQNNDIQGLANHSVIGGGAYNVIIGSAALPVYAVVAGGYGNSVKTNTVAPVIGGGYANIVAGNYSTVAGGQFNTANATWHSTVGGGNANVSSGFGGTIAGGQQNTNGSVSSFAAIGGGQRNTIISGFAGTIPGGLSNVVSGTSAFAAGRQARAVHDGAFVWADSTTADFSSTANDQFLVRAGGGVLFANGAPGVNLDYFNLNNGDLNYGLKFGAGTGEGIASKRTGGGNQYGLDFYTQFTPRMSIAQNGTVSVPGLIRSGVETNTSELPSPAGLVVRRINSTSYFSNNVVARTDFLTLERDGTYGGLLIRYAANPGNTTIAAMGMNNSGTQVNFFNSLPNTGSGGTLVLYNNAQNIVHFECTFGRTYDLGQHLTRVTLTRYNGDFYWSGDIVSTYNQ